VTLCLRIDAVGQKILKIRAKIIVLARLRDCGAVENDRTLIEEFVDDIICDGRVIRRVHIILRSRY